MNLRRSTTSNMTETVLHYNALAKDAGINLRPSWPLVASNDSISMAMLGMCGTSQVLNAYGTSQAAVPRLVQAGKCLATPNFLTSAGPALQAGGGVACSGLTGQRELLPLSKSLATDVRTSDGFMHGSSSSMRLPFFNLQAPNRGPSSLRTSSGSALSCMEDMAPGPSFTQGHTGLSCLPSAGSAADYQFHGQDLTSNLQTMGGDFGQLLTWDHTHEDVEDVWAFSDIDGCAFHEQASGLVTSSASASRGSALHMDSNDQSDPESVPPAASYTTGGSEVTQSNHSATKRPRVSWEIAFDPCSLDQQLPSTIILDDDMEVMTAASRTYGSSTTTLHQVNQCQLPAVSSTGSKTTTTESRLRASRGHNISNIQPVRRNVMSCPASGNSPRSVLAVATNLQGDVHDISQLPVTAGMQQHVNMSMMGMGVYAMRSRQIVYQPCANSQLSQSSHSDRTLVALPQAMDAAAIDIVSSSTSDAASIMTKQLQLNGCADIDAKTICSSGLLKADVDVTCSSFLDSVDGISVCGDKFQQQQLLPNPSSLGISTCNVKGEVVSQAANAPRTSSNHVYAGDQSSLSWPQNNFDLGAGNCQPMPTLDSLSSSIGGWVATASHASNRLQESGLQNVAPGTWQPRFNNLATSSGFTAGVGHVTPPSANLRDNAHNDLNLRKRSSEESMDLACKRLKEGAAKGICAGMTTARTCSVPTSHKGLGPALNTNLKPRARQGSANDPQSIAARHRRERISERLKVLQDLVPNGSKVDLVTMLEKAINYVKSLQLQVKFLTADEYWPDAERGCSPNVQGVSLEAAARLMTESLASAVETESHSNLKGDRQDVSSMDESFVLEQ